MVQLVLYLANMVTGVSQGFERALELVGVGYRAQLQGKKLVLTLVTHIQLNSLLKMDSEVEVPSNTKIIINGIDKERVGALASNIRQVRPPEPYKGKGIRYEGELYVVKKVKQVNNAAKH